MAQVISFEVDTYQNNRWVLECALDDKEMALVTAKRLYESKRFTAVRVVQDTYDDSSNTSRSRVIYETTVMDRENKAAQLKKQAEVQRALERRSERAALRRRPKHQAKKKTGAWVYLLLLVVLLAAGGGALYALQILGSL